MIDIEKLLSKKRKSWSGAEVGKALFANLIQEATKGNSLFTQEDFNRLENGITTERDYNVYNIYRTLYRSIVDYYNKGCYLYSSFFFGMQSYSVFLSKCMDADKAQEAEDELPLILTGGQYYRYAEEAKEAGITIAELLRQGGDTPEERFQRYRRSRRAEKGIAIVQNRNGDYKEPKSPLSVLYSLDDLAKDDNAKHTLSLYMKIRVAPAYQFILAFNALVLILGRVYDIDGIEALQLDTDGINEQLVTLDETVKLFSATVYGTKEEKLRKRELIDQIFTYWKIEELEISEDDIQQVEETLRGYGMTKDTYKNYERLDKYLNMLSCVPLDEDELTGG